MTVSRFGLPVLARLHTLFGLSEQVGFAGQAVVALLSDTGLTRSMARLAFRLLLKVARWAFVHTGAICTDTHTHIAEAPDL